MPPTDYRYPFMGSDGRRPAVAPSSLSAWARSSTRSGSSSSSWPRSSSARSRSRSACHLLKTCCTSRAWRNTIAAAYPDEPVRWRSIYAAYLSGVGVNAIIPARGGDAVRLYLAHRAVPGSTYTTLASTLLVLSIFDIGDGAADLRLRAHARRPARRRLARQPARASTSASSRRTPSSRSCSCVALVDLRRRSASSGSASTSTSSSSASRQGFAVLRDRTEYLRTVAALAGRRLGAALRRDLVLPRRVRDRPVDPERPARPGDAEPRHARPDLAGRDRHRAGVHRLRLLRHRRRPRRRCSPSASG